MSNRKQKIRSSTLNLEFYLYLLSKLNKFYLESPDKEYAGLPSRNAIQEVYNFLTGKSKIEKLDRIQQAIKIERKEVIDKQIYSTYKAASYYVNLAKDKFLLIDQENKLTDSGLELLSLKSGFLNYTKPEKLFFFKRILRADFLMFVSLCFFKKLSTQYNFKDYLSIHFEFLDKCYGISHFNFTSSSLENYNTVRNYWVNILGILDKRMNIRKAFLITIRENPEFNKWYEELAAKFNSFVQEDIKKKKKYFQFKKKLENLYFQHLKEGKSDLGFVNLYDIKQNIKMSHSNFQMFLNDFYDNEKGRKHIFFNNIVSSIDRRKRFLVRGIPVLKIKIKEVKNGN